MSVLIPQVSTDDHYLGKLGAKITLVEYGDFECSICKLSYPILLQMQKELNEECLFVFRYFLLKKKHPHALIAAKAAEAADKQGMYWKMYDALFRFDKPLILENINNLAEQISLNLGQFQSDMQNPAIEEKIEKDFISGLKSDVNGTPCFYINGERFDGDRSYANFLTTLKTSAKPSP